MATNRDVSLNVGVKTTGNEELDKLVVQLRELAKEGGDAAPEFERLANEITTLGSQQQAITGLAQLEDNFAKLSSAVGTVRSRLDELNRKIPENAGEVARLRDRQRELIATIDAERAARDRQINTNKNYRADLSATERKEKEHVDVMRAGQKAVADYNLSIREKSRELSRLNADIGDAVATEKQLSREYKNTQAELVKLEKASAAQAATLQKNRVEAEKLGVSTDSLVSAQADVQNRMEAARVTIEKTALAYGQAAQSANALGVAATEAARRGDSAATAQAEAAQKAATAAAELRQQALAAEKALNDAFAVTGVRSAKQIRDEIEQVRRALDQLSADASVTGADFDRAFQGGQARINRLEQELAGIRPQAQVAATAVKSIATELNRLQQLAALGIGGTILTDIAGDLARVADGYADLSARVKLVTGDGAALQTALAGVEEVALRTNTSLQNTGDLFVRLARAGKELGQSQDQVLAMTETINQAFQITGGASQSAQAALTQFIQGLQSGVLRGEEFNSVNEQAPRIIEALAASLGVTNGELRKLAESGALTTDVILPAIASQGAKIQAEFDQLPKTVNRSMTNLKSAFQIYVNEVNTAGGVTEKVAGAIDLLANNLDAVAETLVVAGKAYIAFKAFDLATKLRNDAISLRDATVATAANTAALAANTAATSANAAAKVAAASATGAHAAAMQSGAVATASFSNSLSGTINSIKYYGTTIASVAARAVPWIAGFSIAADGAELLGKGLGVLVTKINGTYDAEKRLEEQLKKEAQAARESANAKAEAAAQAKLAESAALGLTRQSKLLVAEFDSLRAKGESVADALSKIGKDVNLVDEAGIRAAGEAFNALAVQGKASADEIKAAFATALDGQDLLAFETKARAAFDNSERGAEQLALALDASLRAALERTGLDIRQIETGFSQASTSSLNDIEIILSNLDRLSQKGVNVGAALEASIGNALRKAATQPEIQRVIDIIERAGETGRVSGEKIEVSMRKAKEKLEDVTPGINSLDEAFRTFGMKSQAEVSELAEKYEEAFLKIEESGVASLNTQQEAFTKFAEAAIAANGGVVTSEMQVKAASMGLAFEMSNGAVKVTSAYEQKTRAIQASAQATLAGLNADLNKAKAEEQLATLTGRTGDAIAAKIRQKQIEIQIAEASADAVRRETEAAIKKLDADAREAQQAGAFNDTKRAEIAARRAALEAKLAEAQASDSVVGGLRAEIAALRDLESAAQSAADAKKQASSSDGGSGGGGGTYNKVDYGTEVPDFNSLEELNEYVAKSMEMRRSSYNVNGDPLGFSRAIWEQWDRNVAAARSRLQRKEGGKRSAPGEEGFGSGTSGQVSRVVKIEIGGKATDIGVASDSDADNLVGIIGQIANAARSSQ